MYHKYLSENIEQPSAVFFGIEEQAEIKKNKINKIPFNDAYRQYLNYYLGWGDYSKKVYKTDKKAIIYAKNVQKLSKIYKNQLKECQKNLDKKKYIIF